MITYVLDHAFLSIKKKKSHHFISFYTSVAEIILPALYLLTENLLIKLDRFFYILLTVEYYIKHNIM